MVKSIGPAGNGKQDQHNRSHGSQPGRELMTLQGFDTAVRKRLNQAKVRRLHCQLRDRGVVADSSNLHARIIAVIISWNHGLNCMGPGK